MRAPDARSLGLSVAAHEHVEAERFTEHVAESLFWILFVGRSQVRETGIPPRAVGIGRAGRPPSAMEKRHLTYSKRTIRQFGGIDPTIRPLQKVHIFPRAGPAPGRRALLTA